MQLWPIVLWPKPRARQHAHNIHLQFATRSSTKHCKILQIFIINVLLQITTIITTVKGVVVNAGSSSQYANYKGVESVSGLTGLSNGYATPRNNYIKNYYQQLAEASAKNSQQHLHNEDADRVKQEHQNNHVGGNEVFSHGFMGLPVDNYGNSIVARGEAEQNVNVHDTGLMPITYTAAGQHYAASLVGLQPAITDTNNAHPHMTMATMTRPPPSNTIDLEHRQQQLQQYGPDNVAVADNKAAVHHHHHRMLFGRLSNYGGELVDNVATKNRGHAEEDVGLQNYALAYADDVQQQSTAATPVREQFYYKYNTHNDDNEQQQQQQNFANYITKTIAALPPTTYEMENQQKYYTLNNYQQIEPQQQQQQQQSQQDTEQNNFYNRPLVQEQTHKMLEATATQAPPATYYQTFIKQNNNNDNKQQQYQQQHDKRLNNNYQQGNLKQQQQHEQQSQQHSKISANYLQKQLAKQQQQQQQQYNLQQLQDRWQTEPEMAETSHSGHYRKHLKSKTDSKSKRSDYSGEPFVDLHDTDEVSHLQLQQLQQLQHQLQQQQQQFVNLQHQLIDHDQQLQIHKHQVQQQHQQPPILPPITHTVHHNPYSLQALAGQPLTKHTQIIKSIPVHQLQRVLVPFKHNVSIEVPDPIITTIKKPTPIEIPVTKTIAVPDIQEVKIPIEKIMPYPVERPVPYIVEKRVPYTVEKQVAKPVYYNVPIKVPIVHTVVHKLHKPQHSHHFAQENTIHDNYRDHHRYRSHHLPHSVYKHGHRHGGGHFRYGGKYLK